MIPGGAPRVLADVLAERIRQDEKWGQQNHDTYPGSQFPAIYAKTAEKYKRVNAKIVEACNAGGRSADKNCTWATVLLEEVYEALAESDPVARRAECVQAAAVLVAMIEHIDRQMMENA